MGGSSFVSSAAKGLGETISAGIIGFTYLAGVGFVS
ncbi:hypothetical protein CASFOL_000740 [Castilleja foliolosa]|uniref:Uncharacterized protein n=1 Tax=Castilleja foliolosa TaxID=1961234 RepID=A0ABD3EP04_9LAMI